MQPFDFPGIDASFSYGVFYWSDSTTFRSSRTIFHPITEMVLTRLIVGATYMVTVSPQVRFSACFFSSTSGPESVAVNFTTFALREHCIKHFTILYLYSSNWTTNWLPCMLSSSTARQLKLNGKILNATIRMVTSLPIIVFVSPQVVNVK